MNGYSKWDCHPTEAKKNAVDIEALVLILQL